MWVTCHNCNGTGITNIQENNRAISEGKNKDEYCILCKSFRFIIYDMEFYGQIWIEDDYRIITPPSSP